ncbi:glutaminase [Gordonia otitidis]|uniref:Glutaminase n=1 Tax=Gordonia otitidis (strain DSM 44809 / CCUG 52243 / JCM 12355 / NBRC 100426 / IFM 10032) TaxID=1108044 RepID=H5TTH3_GORO1|nr:glutaminase [Gordonia otitidis]GAB36781.1 glutaminase [Gordonia otitidis NBRC 100426]
MHSPVRDYLTEVLDSLADDDGGAVADYIPELATADPDRCAIALTTVDGRTYSVGDDEVEFSIQSISKPFAYAAALADRGFETVSATVGVEPSGEAFNELSLEGDTCRPRNPMINAGAIATHGLLVGADATEEARVERARSFFSTLAGRELRIDEAVYESEIDSADRNLAIAHMLRNYGIITATPHEIVDGYTRQCSVLVTARDLAMMGACLSNGGIHPTTHERVVDRRVARQVMSVMAGCGMYDGAGEWLTTVGIPAKSGVAGGLLGTLPGQCGIAVFSPRLDEHGNSVRGVAAFRRLSNDMNMHLVDAEPYGTTVLRNVVVAEDTTTFQIQGVIQFSGAEYILDALDSDETTTPTVIFDVSQVSHFSDVGRRMVLEGMRRVRLDGRRVVLIDPDDALPDPDLGDGTYPDRLG